LEEGKGVVVGSVESKEDSGKLKKGIVVVGSGNNKDDRSSVKLNTGETTSEEGVAACSSLSPFANWDRKARCKRITNISTIPLAITLCTC